ncbi:TfoX/Sxy family protein [Sphingomonas sp.]|uniref:TfoX/Sxy family protein n=1 Tax=Sphingomonas sp. TaxID=28214 RepID=UPI001D1E7344|nr:TfoX/Sxy family protein [Sphingomonas sp.]MBX9797654.1 TfoX/Sxy family protein [Sphingomonas sp.]
MAFDAGLVGWVAEALAPLGDVSHRPMMGGAALYLDGTIFALVDGDALWFKADAESDADWDAIGAERFSFTKADGQVAVMRYRRAPDDVYDDADAMRHWAALAVAAGQRAAAAKRPKRGG